ncbi:MAG: orotidine-5'-phosphate decarboxylase [Actinomycetes bacterium]
MPETFSRLLEQAFSKNGQLCVGIDPHEELLDDSGFDQSVDGLRHFSMALLDELSGTVSIIKPQVSFFERFGSAGFRVLEDLCAEASSRGFLVIADAKRGDIGSTMTAYAQAWLGKAAPFIVDALTVSPFLGVGSLAPAVAIASERGKGLFVLCATSNPEGQTLQMADSEGISTAKSIANEVSALNQVSAQSKTQFGNMGLVIGATVNLEAYGLKDVNTDSSAIAAPILAPGFGAQGARLSEAKRIFGSNADKVVYTISRSALRNGLHSVKSVVVADQQELAQALSE